MSNSNFYNYCRNSKIWGPQAEIFVNSGVQQMENPTIRTDIATVLNQFFER